MAVCFGMDLRFRPWAEPSMIAHRGYRNGRTGQAQGLCPYLPCCYLPLFAYFSGRTVPGRAA